MLHTERARGPVRIHGLLVTLAVVTGCITADGTLQHDGAATLTLSFRTVATVEDDTAARALVSATGVTIESIVISDEAPDEPVPRRATVKLSTKDVATFDTLPLLRVIGTTIVHEPKPDGSGSLRLSLKNERALEKDDPQVAEMMKQQASLRLQLPGPIIATSATQKDGLVEWTFPAGDWSLGKRLEMTVSYGPAPDAEKPASPTTEPGARS